jgi:hypothetical protein
MIRTASNVRSRVRDAAPAKIIAALRITALCERLKSFALAKPYRSYVWNGLV